MLPSYPDCARRAAAKQLPQVITEAGFELRQTLPSAGAAVGTAVHKVEEVVMKARLENATATLDDGLEQAMAGFDEETAPGCEWDDTTQNRNTAQQQIIRMAKSAAVLWERLDPLAVEVELEADLGGGFKLTGHCDLITTDGWVRDLKTGAMVRPYFHQLGGYSLLVRSKALLPAVNGLAIDFIKRTPLRRPQDAPVEQSYPVPACERAAYAVIQRIKREVVEFQGSGNPEVFVANPLSMMCTPKYCPAFGTGFCELTRR
jgi:hypothetical protein